MTLVPALAMSGLSDDMGLQDRRLEEEGAARQINLTVRKSASRRALVDRIAEIIRSGLPDSVKVAKADPDTI